MNKILSYVMLLAILASLSVCTKKQIKEDSPETATPLFYNFQQCYDACVVAVMKQVDMPEADKREYAEYNCLDWCISFNFSGLKFFYLDEE